ncbi:MAG TPA: ribosome maturation factor RimP [Cellulomonas sp.]|nr:ribosome maturation factor RimP [Cellulomonas sp.]
MPAPAHTQRVRDAVEPLIAAAGLYLEDVEVTSAGARSVVRIVVDLEEDAVGGLDLDRVAAISRDISTAIDATDAFAGELTLEVSSPGVSRPLTERRHFTRARGRLVTLRMRDGSTLTARLVDVDRSTDDAVLVLVPEVPAEKGRRPVHGEPVRLRLAEVRDGHVEVELGRMAELPDDAFGDVLDDDETDEPAHDPTGLEG